MKTPAKRRKKKVASRPLVWTRDQLRENFYGHTVTGDLACYVYENVDMRLRNQEPSWMVHFYLGRVERPMKGKSRLGYFATRGLAKRAAQKAWRKLRAVWMGQIPAEKWKSAH